MGPNGFAVDINARGQVLAREGFSPPSQPYAINDRGDVVGERDGRATLWRRLLSVAIVVNRGDSTTAIRRAGGITQVALLSSTSFDATSADVTTIEFAGAPSLRQRSDDVDGDGLSDVIHQFKSSALVLDDTATVACLRGETTAGVPFRGCSSVCAAK